MNLVLTEIWICYLPNSPKKKFQIFLKFWEGEFECTELMGIEMWISGHFIVHT